MPAYSGGWTPLSGAVGHVRRDKTHHSDQEQRRGFTQRLRQSDNGTGQYARHRQGQDVVKHRLHLAGAHAQCGISNSIGRQPRSVCSIFNSAVIVRGPLNRCPTQIVCFSSKSNSNSYRDSRLGATSSSGTSIWPLTDINPSRRLKSGSPTALIRTWLNGLGSKQRCQPVNS